ncbi:hypothetical protein BB559_003474 [Furculomyces boomerangus]|uniref:Uncharacterized protein n=2 Tax=Harpellales TaxID=61421 RepID=A0A2T9YF50_9FUNG|nr:hypothetical protein BB559_004389 [Furculomyces boomerangus]PVU93052.1 hypothetical protein BB559_003474 [Furculomyces boomerangus]PWA01452.1 hypothetical protein BB558_002465 [Smittium angustum]
MSNTAGLSFGKRLAHVDKNIRDAAISKLTKFMSSRNEFSEQEMLKLWKAIYYCFWLSDKPIVQQDLADQIARIPLLVKRKVATLYFQTFWQTMLREWPAIDKHRINKYYMLMRVMFRYNLVFIKNNDFDNAAFKDYSHIMRRFPLHPTNPKFSDGIRSHVCDIFFDELLLLVKTCDSPDMPLDKLLAPIIEFANNTSNERLFNLFLSDVLEYPLTYFRRLPKNDFDENFELQDEETNKEAIITHSIGECIYKLLEELKSKENSEEYKTNGYNTLYNKYKSTFSEITNALSSIIEAKDDISSPNESQTNIQDIGQVASPVEELMEDDAIIEEKEEFMTEYILAEPKEVDVIEELEETTTPEKSSKKGSKRKRDSSKKKAANSKDTSNSTGTPDVIKKGKVEGVNDAPVENNESKVDKELNQEGLGTPLLQKKFTWALEKNSTKRYLKKVPISPMVEELDFSATPKRSALKKPSISSSESPIGTPTRRKKNKNAETMILANMKS